MYSGKKIGIRHSLFYCSIVLLFLFFCQPAFSQEQPYGAFSEKERTKTEKKLLKSAQKEFETGNYSLATAKYSELLKMDSANAVYNFEQAQTLYNNSRPIHSIPFFERCLRHSTDSFAEVYYFLANALQLNGKFDRAEKYYSQYLSLLNIYGTDLPQEEENELRDELEHKMEMCRSGKVLSQTAASRFTLNGKTRSFRIVSMGKNVNSKYDDYGTVLTADDSQMYFTSRRDGTTGGKVDWDDKYFEDIYLSVLSFNGWGECFNIGMPVNTGKHEGIVSISADGKTLYFYKGVRQGTFFSSTLFGSAWTEPRLLFEKSDVNTKAWETSFFGFVLADDELYVVSDREGGTGGRDIYISRKQPDGLWGPLANLGETINTRYDEDAPFISADRMTMYFSSRGHNSMGGFDIFKSVRLPDGKWSAPENLGPPFNTPGEEIYFITANKSDRAFFSSSLLNRDSTTDMDIYMIDLCDDIPEVILAGKTFGITNGTIAVSEKETENKIGDFKIENEKYSIPLKHGKEYRFTLNIQDIEPVSIDVSIPQMCKVYDLYQEIVFPGPGQMLAVRNAFFDIKEKSELTGITDYSELLRKMDKTSFPLFTEQSLATVPALVLAKADTLSDTTSVSAAATGTLTASSTTTATATTTTTAATTTAVTTTTTATAGVTTISIGNILFDYDRAEIKEEFYSELDKVTDFLKNINKKTKIKIRGHTDSKGFDGYNLALSQKRAGAVANYFASKGIGKNRMKVTGYGESKPLAPNENPDGSDNPEGRAKNRRIEIVVIQ